MWLLCKHLTGLLMAKKELCVGTVYPNCDARCSKWFELQQRYLQASTPEFDHVTAVHHGEISPLFSNNSHIIRVKATEDTGRRRPLRGSEYHVRGLNVLARYFRLKLNQYKLFLLLDMDAFPIRNNWITLLRTAMARNKHSVAVAYRAEACERRLHSSIVFGSGSTIAKMQWKDRFVQGRQNLIGYPERDVQLFPYERYPDRRAVFVLLRSNKFQLHPILCGVYFDMFYHHGQAGAGNATIKIEHYWRHIGTLDFMIQDTADKLFEDPNAMIPKLAGWSPEEYVTV